MFTKTRMPSISDNAIFPAAYEDFRCLRNDGFFINLPNERVFDEVLYCQFNFVTINEGCGMDILK